jgi:HK97 family phage major capsid protein
MESKLINNNKKMNLLDKDVAKVINALGGNIGKSEQSDVIDYSKNANELMHTANTGFGKEVIPVDVLSQKVIDMIPQYATFLNSLPGFHGTGMAISEKVAVIGETGFFAGNTEPTTGAQAIRQPANRLATGEVTISQAQLIADVFLTKRELNYSIVDLESLVQQKLAASLARTIESMIVNGDDETGSTGNVNSDDQAPATTFGATDHRILIDHGIRELSINNSFAKNAGTLDNSDFLAVMNYLGDLASDPNDCLWIFNRATYNKALGLAEFYKANERGVASTLAGNAITNIFGSDLFISRAMPKTEADGKMSATPGNNVLGQFAYVYKPAIQYGYGQPFEIELTRVAGKGLQLTATCEFGFTIVQKKAGMDDSSVGLGINITL